MMTGKVVLWSVSIWWTFYKRPKVCYKKWLGPDWTPSYKNPGCKISNHSSWADILVHMQYQPPSYVAKSSVRKVPFVGTIAELCGCLFFDRSS